MHTIPQHSGGVATYVLLITGLFIVFGLMAANTLAVVEPFLVLGLMLILGLPHGATDHGLYQSMWGGNKRTFLFFYGIVIALYGLVWYLAPLVAFGVFILLSIYHFGQSNWVNSKYANPSLARGHYLLWGSGILLTPILLHAGEAAAIVSVMTGIELPVDFSPLPIIISLGCLNILVIALRFFRGEISSARCGKELLGYGLLMGLFFTNSLLLGFTVYFVCWHSLSSALDQVRFFNRKPAPDLLRQLRWEIGYTVLGALLFCGFVWLGPGPQAALTPAIMGGVFVFISLLTLPHMLLIEELYVGWSLPYEGLVQKRTMGTTSGPVSRVKQWLHQLQEVFTHLFDDHKLKE